MTRIVSLLPSATEIVWSLGLADQLVGVSHSCDFPEEVTELPVMTRTSVPVDAPSEEIDAYVRKFLGINGSLYQLNTAALGDARPDVIISQRLCEICAVSSSEVETLLEALPGNPELIDLTPSVLEDVFDDILRVGRLLGTEKEARKTVDSLINRMQNIAERTGRIAPEKRPRVAVLEWLIPPFNSGHWVPELVEIAGGINVLGKSGEPSETVSWDDVLAARPDVLLLSCCGFDRQRMESDIKQLEEKDQWQELMKMVDGAVHFLDGSAYFARPGPRLIDGLEQLARILHPSGLN